MKATLTMQLRNLAEGWRTKADALREQHAGNDSQALQCCLVALETHAEEIESLIGVPEVRRGRGGIIIV